MAHILIVYGTTEGQTEKISEAIAKEISDKGHRVRTFLASEAPTGNELDAFDAVIVGSSVHAGKFDKTLRKWARWNFVFLQRKPSAFFSVCLGILEKNFKAKREEADIVAKFFREAGWTPEFHTIFAGALKYSRYGWLKKLVMRSIAKRAGGDTDTSRDYEYTNWTHVRNFAQRFEAMLGKTLESNLTLPERGVLRMSISKKVNTIVWPIDPFQQADEVNLKVAKVIQGITKKWHAKVQPVYILSPENFNIYSTFWIEWEAEHRALAEKKLRSLLKKSGLRNLLPPRVILEPALLTRAMVGRLLDFATENSASLIVTATHGRRGIKRLLMGSFAETLALKSTIPLLMVNPSFKGNARFDKVFFPTDLRKGAEESFLKAVRFSKLIKAELMIYFHFSGLSSPKEVAKPNSYKKFELEQLRKFRVRALRLASMAKSMGVKTSLTIDREIGMHDDLIVKQSRAKRSQIIAMVPERGGAEAAIFGSITRTVLRQAACPVWVLRQ